MASDGLTVAVTGPTGDLGIGIVTALERSQSVKRIEEEDQDSGDLEDR